MVEWWYEMVLGPLFLAKYILFLKAKNRKKCAGKRKAAKENEADWG